MSLIPSLLLHHPLAAKPSFAQNDSVSKRNQWICDNHIETTVLLLNSEKYQTNVGKIIQTSRESSENIRKRLGHLRIKRPEHLQTPPEHLGNARNVPGNVPEILRKHKNFPGEVPTTFVTKICRWV